MEDDSQKKIVYLGELDGDADDAFAVEYLYNKNVLKCIVGDPKPTTKVGKISQSNFEKLWIEVYFKIPERTDIIFCGRALTSLAEYLEKNKISTLVMNGGFVGDNIIPKEDRLAKFDWKKL